MPYIDHKYRNNLSNYRYSGVDKSLVSRYVLSKYWSWLVTFFPLTVAPNLITLSGLICILFNILTLLYYAPDLGPCPQWVHLTFALGLWVYQSLDAIDGKQARRTGTSGPLGELFDHGLGSFYLSTWEEYHTGTLYLSYFSGPVEGILAIIAIHIISGIYGAEVWLTHIDSLSILPAVAADALPPFLAQLQINEAFLLFGAVGLSANTFASSINVYRAAVANHRPILPALAGLVPFFSASVTAYMWLHASPTIVTDHLIPFALYIGCSFGYQVGLIIVAHVTEAPFPFVNLMMVPLIIGCVNANLPIIANIQPFFTGAKEAPFLWVAFAFSLVHYLHFAISVINDLCDYFDINCLTIKHKKEQNGGTKKVEKKE
ncbi:choline ethanolaminephosphotransferase [Jimgerdemannia flammicorona]|uniref:Choline ethanolaminephosphotransferase n=1 Tax=Jimgerdemannia flammicorona TaxID=994334 RepID=A0A433DC89_9FUNG|nr:choline ethanolaminephosphotransferase [Jimgerdemannia flammicorona]